MNVINFSGVRMINKISIVYFDSDSVDEISVHILTLWHRELLDPVTN